MKFDLKHKPELFASKDETRPHLTQCHLDVEAAKLVATDGHRLIVLPVEVDEHDHTGWVSAEALEAARKAERKRRGTHATIAANGALATGADGTGPTFPRRTQEEAGPFPPYQHVVGVPTTRYVVDFAVNASYLAEAAKAMGSDSLRIRLFVDEPRDTTDPTLTTLNPIHVTNEHTAPGALCVVMPMRL